MTGRHEVDEVTGWMNGLGLPVAFVLANGLLLAPGWIVRGAPGPPWLAGEAVLPVTVFLLLPARRWTGFVAGAVAAALVACGALLLGDAAARASLARPMNLYLDWHLLRAVWNLMVGALGMIPAVLGSILFVGAMGLAAWGIAGLLARGRATDSISRVRIVGAVTLAVALLVLTGWSSLWSAVRDERSVPLPALGSIVAWPGVTLAIDQTRRVRALLEERDRFARELRRSRSSHGDVANLLGKLDERSVVLGFIESYGMTVLRDPRYSKVLRPRLEELGRRMDEAGLSLASGALVAPTQGGQSWFSHGSLLSGLWLDNQAKYDVLMTTDRETLIDDFSRAGYETVALMPAITLAWPEGEWFGYDQIYAFQDIDYAGPSLNWVTMPDQFTWSFLEHEIGTKDRARPVFAEVGLISSHAPWTPILPVLSDWGAIGDGSVFAPWKDAGESPEELWRDPERVREHFALSVDYAVNVMTAYAERYVSDEMLLIVMGDHQPAPLITGEGASRAVPVHVISGDRDLIEPFLRWGFRAGPVPDPAAHPRRMDAFREWFVEAYSGTTEPQQPGRPVDETGEVDDGADAKESPGSRPVS